MGTESILPKRIKKIYYYTKNQVDINGTTYYFQWDYCNQQKTISISNIITERTIGDYIGDPEKLYKRNIYLIYFK